MAQVKLEMTETVEFGGGGNGCTEITNSSVTYAGGGGGGQNVGSGSRIQSGGTGGGGDGRQSW